MYKVCLFDILEQTSICLLQYKLVFLPTISKIILEVVKTHLIPPTSGLCSTTVMNSVTDTFSTSLL